MHMESTFSYRHLLPPTLQLTTTKVRRPSYMYSYLIILLRSNFLEYEKPVFADWVTLPPVQRACSCPRLYRMCVVKVRHQKYILISGLLFKAQITAMVE